MPTLTLVRQLLERSAIRSQKGVTLIEALAGIIMLSLGLLTLLPMATVSISANELARDTADAAQSLQNEIERLRNEPVITAGARTDPETGFYTHWWVDTEPNGLQKVHVEVQWYTDLGVTRIQRATTYLYRNDDDGVAQ